MTPTDRHRRYLAAQAATLSGDVLQELDAIREDDFERLKEDEWLRLVERLARATLELARDVTAPGNQEP